MSAANEKFAAAYDAASVKRDVALALARTRFAEALAKLEGDFARALAEAVVND